MQIVARAHGLDPRALRSSTIAEAGLTRPTTIVLDMTRADDVLKTRFRPAAEILATATR